MNAAIGAVLASSLERNEAWALIAMLTLTGPDGLVTATQLEISQTSRLARSILIPAIQALIGMGLVGAIPEGRRLKYVLNVEAIKALTCPPHGHVEPTCPPHGQVTCPPHGHVEPTCPPHGQVTCPPHGHVEPTCPPHGQVATHDESIEPASQPCAPEVKTELEQSEAKRRARLPGEGFGETLNEALDFYPLGSETQDSTGPLEGLRECEDRWLEIAGKGRRFLNSDETFVISELIIQHGGPGPVLEGMARLVQNFERWTMTTLRLAMIPKPASQSRPPRPAAPMGSTAYKPGRSRVYRDADHHPDRAPGAVQQPPPDTYEEL